MSIIRKIGDILKSDAEIIAHQCNVHAIFGSGLARKLADLYPDCEKQSQQYVENMGLSMNYIGSTHFYRIPNTEKYIANNFTQRSDFVTVLEAVEQCFNLIKVFAKGKGIKTVAVPWNYGVDYSRGTFVEIEHIIESIFNDCEIELQWWIFE